METKNMNNNISDEATTLDAGYASKGTAKGQSQATPAQEQDKSAPSQEQDKGTETQAAESKQGAPKKKTLKEKLKNVAVAGGAGFAFGVGGAVLKGSAMPPVEDVEENTDETEAGDEIVAETEAEVDVETDGISVGEGVPFADSVNDEMSFSQAFAAARADVGPGGVFEWHGRLYNTYYAEEWSGMSEEDRAEFNGNVVAALQNGEAEDIQHDDAGTDSEPEVTVDESSDVVTEPEVTVDEPVDVPAEPEVTVDDSSDTSSEPEVSVDESVDVMTESDEPQVEVLGVLHDYDEHMNYGFLDVEGEEVALIDVDNDGTFDFVASDHDGDGEISDDEIEELDDNITVDDLGGFTDPVDEVMGADDLDYTA